MKTNQTTDAIRPALTPITPDLNHRFCHLYKDHRDLTDSVHIMTSRALGSLSLLSTQFETDDAHTLCNEIIYQVIDGISQELQDIQAYLKAYSDAQ
ncbi:MAG: hypothetical protein QX194_04845 [Methylococcales bacterium]